MPFSWLDLQQSSRAALWLAESFLSLWVEFNVLLFLSLEKDVGVAFLFPFPACGILELWAMMGKLADSVPKCLHQVLVYEVLCDPLFLICYNRLKNLTNDMGPL